MKCDHCHGFGRIAVQTKPPAYRLDSCPQCHGTGIVACCEGICEQPPPEQQREHRRAQRKSWVIGEMMLEHPEMTREQAAELYLRQDREQ